MNLCGIIVEYNPFHNGHMLHINKAKELSMADGTIAVMSGNFCQRGDFSVIDKFAKAEIAINHGVDLVVELPYLYATQNASKFAYGAINVLKACHINHLVFGSETNDIEILKDIASTEINPDHLKEIMKQGNSYPKAYSILSGEFMPNDILAISYLKELRGTNINPICIPRTNAYHSKELSEIASATSIRQAIINKQDYSMATDINVEHPIFIKDAFPYLRRILMTTSREDLSAINLVSEGIEKVLIKNAFLYNDYDDFINASTSRRYTKARIQRILLQILIQIKKSDVKDIDCLNYVRVLAFNDKGLEIIKYLQTKGTNIITQFKQLPDNYRQIEYRASVLYASFFDEKRSQYLIKRELQGPYIKK